MELSARVTHRPHRSPHASLCIVLAAAVIVGGCAKPSDAAAPPTEAPPPARAPSAGPSGPLRPAATLEPAGAAAEPAPSREAPAAGGYPLDPGRTAPPPRAPDAAPAASPTAPAAAPEAPVPQPFAMNLADAADFVGQYTFEWCVGSSLQMALNIAAGNADQSRGFQQDLWEMARDRSSSPYGGANPRGWTAALNELGVGPYELVSIPTFDEAVEMAAGAIRATERPVGLVMWRGRHAWVMSGFESVGDPASDADVEVTAVRVLDPLYPHGSSVWGASPKPNSLVSLDALGRQFARREFRPHYDLGVPAGWLLVLPVPAAG
jgi:hypothetical protein